MSLSPSNIALKTPLISTTNEPAHKPLGALKPMGMEPEWNSARTQSSQLSVLLDIERLEIAKAASEKGTKGKHQQYTVSIYLRQQLKLIDGKSGGFIGSSGDVFKPQPDIQVLRSVSQFCSLRNSVHSCVQARHPGSRCAFCEQLTRFAKYGSGRAIPFANVAVNPAANASSLLHEFMSQALQQSQLALTSPEGSECRGKLQLARLLHYFIFRSQPL